MGTPEGKLTPVQFEIMQLIWDSDQGLTIGEIWEAIRAGAMSAGPRCSILWIASQSALG